MNRLTGFILLVLILFLLSLGLLFQNREQEKLIIYHAGSLSVPIAEIAERFKRSHKVEIQAEASGSIEVIRKIVELGKKPDLIAVADYNWIPKMLMPDYVDFYVIFAKNEIVLAYSNGTRYANEINSENWYEILNRDVSFGLSDPNSDPCGYRALAVLKLADHYYSREIFNELIERNTNIRSLNNTILVPESIQTNSKVVLRPKEVDLSALLESRAIDYVFTYKSIAKQHNFSYVELPAEVNLGDPEKAERYSKIKFLIKAQKIDMEPITYGVAVLKNAPNKSLALEFLKFMLGEEGRGIFERNYHEFIPAKGFGDVPEELRGVLS
ncbi:MAG: tungstate ABC transporter substrate-binding protein WtpA [Archaeoglobales archaeon]|nr:tungstate ABC transporter substrate-binding protein WtpA [Archaeoglobales archaeon]